MIDISAIEKRHEAATEGSHIGDLLKQLGYARKEGITDASRRLNESGLRSIAESLQDIPDLIEEVRRLRKGLEFIRDMADAGGGQNDTERFLFCARQLALAKDTAKEVLEG